MDILVGVLKLLFTWGLVALALLLGGSAVFALFIDQTGLAIVYGVIAIVLLALVQVLRKKWD